MIPFSTTIDRDEATRLQDLQTLLADLDRREQEKARKAAEIEAENSALDAAYLFGQVNNPAGHAQAEAARLWKHAMAFDGREQNARAIDEQKAQIASDRMNAAAAEMQYRASPGLDKLDDQGKLNRLNRIRRQMNVGPVDALPTKETAAEFVGGTTGDSFLKALPISGAVESAIDYGDVYYSSQALESGNFNAGDVENVAGFMEQLAAESRGKTIPAQALNIVSGLPTMAAEFLMSGGLATGARALVKKGAKEAVEETVERSLLKVVAGKAKTAAIDAALRLPAFAPHIAADAIQRMMPEMSMSEDDKGMVQGIVMAEGDGFVEALMKATGNQYIEVFSEMSGGIAKPVTARIKAAIIGDALKRGATANSIMGALEQAGWNGPLSEFGEERLAEIMKMAIGEMPSSNYEQWAAELMGFSVPGLAARGAGAVLDRERTPRESGRTPKPTAVAPEAAPEAAPGVAPEAAPSVESPATTPPVTPTETPPATPEPTVPDGPPRSLGHIKFQDGREHYRRPGSEYISVAPIDEPVGEDGYRKARIRTWSPQTAEEATQAVESSAPPSSEAESTAKTMVPATNQEASEVVGRLPRAEKRWSREELMTDQGGREFLAAQPEVADLIARSEDMFTRKLRKQMGRAGLIKTGEFHEAADRAAFIQHLRTLRSTQGATSGQTQEVNPSEVPDAQANEADEVRDAQEVAGDTARQADDAGLLTDEQRRERIARRRAKAIKVRDSEGNIVNPELLHRFEQETGVPKNAFSDAYEEVDSYATVKGWTVTVQFDQQNGGMQIAGLIPPAPEASNVADTERTDGGTGLLGAPAATAGSRRSVAADPLGAARVDATRGPVAGAGGPAVGTPPMAIPSNQPRTMQVDASPDTAPIEAPEIIKAAERVTGAPIKTGGKRFGMRKAGGTYDPASHGIDQKTANDLNTAAHEVGHALHKRLLDLKTTWPKAVKRELNKLGNDLYKESEPAGGYQREGFAEYVAKRLWGEDVAAQTPATDAWFRETVEKAHPEEAVGIAELEGLFARWNRQGALKRVKAAISFTGKPPKEPAKTRVGKAIQKLIRYLQNDTEAGKRLDAHLASIEPLELGESPYAMMRLLTGKHPAMAMGAIENGVRSLVGDRRYLSKGIKDALSNLGKFTTEKYRDWVVFAYSRHALEMWEKRNMNPGSSKADLKVAVDAYKDEPGFVETANAFRDFHNALVTMYQEVGGLTQEAADLILGVYDFYVPMMRVMDEAAPGKEGKGRGGKPVKRQTGGGQQVIEPLLATLQMAERFYRAASIVKINRAIYNAYHKRAGKLNGQGEGLASWIHEVDAPVEMMKSKVGDMAAQIEAAGGDLSDADMDAVLAIVRQDSYYKGRDSVIPILVDGKPVWFRIDPDLFQAITNLDPLGVGPALHTLPGRIITGVSRLKRLGVTELKALFGLFTNPARDIVTRTMRTEGSAVLAPFTTVSQMVRDLAHGVQRIAGKEGKDSIDKIVDFFGGEMAGFIGQDMDKAKHQADNLLREAQGKGGINHLIHPLRLIRSIFGAVEQSPRKAELAMILEKWGYSREDMAAGKEPPIELIAEAMMLYSGVTTDFSMAGIIGRPWNKVKVFTNAMIQDVFRDVDLFKPQRLQRTLIRGFFLMTLPTMAYWALVKDEDWYKQLPAWRKLNFWNIPMGGGWVLPIPRPFLLGTIFAGLPEMILDTAYRKDPEPLKDWSNQLRQEYGPGLDTFLPDFIETPVEVYLNHKFFGDRPIVPQELQALKPEDQYTQYTSEPSKLLSRGMAAATRYLGYEFSVSPMKLDHMVKGYFGVGADLLNADKGIGAALGTRRLNAPTTRGRAVDDFYAQRTAVNAELGSARRNGSMPADLRAKAYRYESFADLMGKLRDLNIDPGQRDRYITGLALAANGQEPLKSYPNPITDGAAPAEVRGAVLEWLGGKVYSAGREESARGESDAEAAERAREINQSAKLLKATGASPAMIEEAARLAGGRRGYTSRSIYHTTQRALERAQ